MCSGTYELIWLDLALFRNLERLSARSFEVEPAPVESVFAIHRWREAGGCSRSRGPDD
jgi:hypothetical protein